MWDLIRPGDYGAWVLVSVRKPYAVLPLFCLMVVIGKCFARGIKKLWQKMRTVCEVMTFNTPGVSFSVVLLKLSRQDGNVIFIGRGRALFAERIAVNVSIDAGDTLGTASRSVHSAVNDETAVSDQYALRFDKDNGYGMTIV